MIDNILIFRDCCVLGVIKVNFQPLISKYEFCVHRLMKQHKDYNNLFPVKKNFLEEFANKNSPQLL
jgi:hypothetical protein